MHSLDGRAAHAVQHERSDISVNGRRPALEQYY